MRGLNIVVLKVYFMTPLMIEAHTLVFGHSSCLVRNFELSVLEDMGSALITLDPKKWLTLCHCVIGPKRERG